MLKLPVGEDCHSVVTLEGADFLPGTRRAAAAEGLLWGVLPRTRRAVAAPPYFSTAACRHTGSPRRMTCLQVAGWKEVTLYKGACLNWCLTGDVYS